MRVGEYAAPAHTTQLGTRRGAPLRTDGRRDFLFTWQGGRLSEHTLNSLIAALCKIAGVPRYTSHRFRHTLVVQWRRNGMRIETIGQMLGHRSLQMTPRYAAVMPPTMRRELDAGHPRARRRRPLALPPRRRVTYPNMDVVVL